MDRDVGRGARGTLRRLANTAWERELNAELTSLAMSFDQWTVREIGPHELSDRIHIFHDGAARKLYGLYTRVDSSAWVAPAVGLDVLSESELPPSLLEALARSIEYYRRRPRAAGDDDERESRD